MSPEETEVARALMGLPGWRWAPGMVGITHAGARWVVYHTDEAGTPMAVRMDDPRARPAVSAIAVGTLPDLSHRATAGALLGMLESTGQITSLSPGVAGGWYIEFDADPVSEPSIYGDSLGLAVARALLAVGRGA